MPGTSTSPLRRTLARPERTRFVLGDDAAGGTPLELPGRSAGMVTVIVAAMFAVFAGVLVYVIATLDLHGARSVSALAGMLFKLFWILGCSLGVLVLGALTVLLCFYRESARLEGGRLVFVSSLGPLKTIAEYDLARMRNVRVEPGGDTARVRFDYREGSRTLGNAMPTADAERIVAAMRGAMPAAGLAPSTEPAAPPAFAPPRVEQPAAEAPRPLGSVLALVAANLAPLLGVLLLGWRLDEVIVLFWAESAVVGFYTLLKMAVVGRWLAPLAGVFFVGHFGMFMAIHFLFIYEMFVRGVHAHGPEPGALEALAGIFTPLWPALLALVLSHGVSFATNFLGRREYRGASISDLMAAPYRRVMLMQFTLILGGWGVIALENPMPALVLLIVLKVGADLYAHRRERGMGV
jgi:hypothetical protein